MKRKLFIAFAVLALSCLLAIGVSAEACTEHTYETAVITKAPTCTKAGVMTYTCSVCGGTETAEIPAAHTYHAEATTKATCETEGVLTLTCTVEGCGNTTAQTIPMHTLDEGTVTTKPTCSAVGVKSYKCINCDYTETEDIPMHNYTSATVLKVPSCYFAGSIKFTCTGCSVEFTREVDKTHEYEEEVITQADCATSTEGVVRHTCVHCGSSHKETVAPKHSYNVGGENVPTSIVYEDFTKTGVKYFKCANCTSNEGLIANAIFTFNGYSATAYDATVENCTVEITAGYKIDIDALQEYQRVMGADKLQYGAVGAVQAHFDNTDTPPLVSGTAEPQAAATKNNIKYEVKKIAFNGNTYSTANAKLINIDYDNHTTYFYLCLYVYDGTKTVYISDDSCREVPLPISYSMIVKGDSSHDTVSSEAIFGDITYSTVKGTEPDASRVGLIADSAKAYLTEEVTEESQTTEQQVGQIGTIGMIIGTLENAQGLLDYYLELGGDATHYHDLNVAGLITESATAKESWETSINNILRAAEVLAIERETVNIDQTTETAVELPTSSRLDTKRDWYLSFIDGAYHTDTDLNNLTVTVAEDGTKTYTAQIVYTVIDYYSFYPYHTDNVEETSSFLLLGPTKDELAQLHLDGSALDFLIESAITYNVTWTEGQRVAQDNSFNSETEIVADILTTVTEETAQ